MSEIGGMFSHTKTPIPPNPSTHEPKTPYPAKRERESEIEQTMLRPADGVARPASDWAWHGGEKTNDMHKAR